jgi:hypothetical protein
MNLEGSMLLRSFGLVVGLAAVGVLLFASVSPASAQLAAGCSCPSGSIVSGNQCALQGAALVLHAPVCTGSGSSQTAISQSVGRLASSQQQLSFSGIQSLLEGRRDQLQGNSEFRRTSPISGYSPFDLDDSYGALGYSRETKKALPAPFYKAAPSPVSTGPSWGSWVEGLGDWQRNDPVAANDLQHFTSTYGAQAGIDGTWQGLTSGNDAVVVGVIASWMSSKVIYDGSPTSLTMSGPGIGAYATYLNGNFSTDLAIKGDFLRMNEDFGGATPGQSVDVTNFGVSGNVQYKIATSEKGFFEPTGGFSFTRTFFGDNAIALDLKDASTLRLQAGARFGTSLDVNAVKLEPTLKVLAYSNVVADGSSITSDAIGAAIVPTDQGKVRGELDPQLNADFGNGYSALLAGQVRFGDQLVGGSASLMLRKQW